MKTTFDSLLNTITQDSSLLTRWLDLLSLLEYVGARKILKSRPFDQVDCSTLQHISEEALHAFLLKDLVKKRGQEDSWIENPWTELGWSYFQSVDREICEGEQSEIHYPLVSWAVEQRVLWHYPQLLQACEDPNVKRVLRQILGQEKRHEKQFDEDEKLAHAKARAKEIENKHWEQFVAQLSSLFSSVDHLQKHEPQPLSYSV